MASLSFNLKHFCHRFRAVLLGKDLIELDLFVDSFLRLNKFYMVNYPKALINFLLIVSGFIL